MAKLTGTKLDGSAFALNITARTRRLALHAHTDLAALDLAALTTAPGLELFEMGSSPVAITSVAPIGACTRLTNLSLSVPADTDLSPLASCPELRHVSLYLHGDAPCDTAAIAAIPALTSLSISQRGESPPLDLTQLARAASLESLSLDGPTNTQVALPGLPTAFRSLNITKARNLVELDLGPLASTQLVYLMLHTCPALRHLDLAPLATVPLERLTLFDVGVEDLSLYPLARCATLKYLQVLNHSTRMLDVTPLAKLPLLAGLDLDGKDAPMLSDASSITSPAVRAWHKAGRLSVE